MTVADLISKLRQFDENLEVAIPIPGDLCEIDEIIEIDDDEVGDTVIMIRPLLPT